MLKLLPDASPTTSMQCQPPTTRARFTLIELMVIIGLLAVLASVFLPLLSDSVRRAREKDCGNNLRRIGVALGIYSDTSEGYFPLTYGTLSTSGTRAWESSGISSMQGLIQALDDDAQLLVCPTVWHHASKLPHAGPQGWAWGYEKWAGTLNTHPLNLRGAFYSRYQDINSVRDLGPALWRPGYLSEMAMSQATRRYIVLGSSFGTTLNWQSAMKPNVVSNLGGPGRIPPSEIAMFSDTNRVNHAGAITTSHSRVGQTAGKPTVPPAIHGLNELLGDGHVRWYGLPGNSLYYISDNTLNGAGVFVQDNR